MMILARKLSERIVLTIPPSDQPQTVTIMPTEIKSELVRVGIVAHKEIRIDRGEVHDLRKAS